jgi:hypothetical protein
MTPGFTHVALALLLAIALQGCGLAGAADPGFAPQQVVTVVRVARPPLPSDCASPGPAAPHLGGGTVGDVLDHIEALDKTATTLRGLRAACKAALVAQRKK